MDKENQNKLFKEIITILFSIIMVTSTMFSNTIVFASDDSISTEQGNKVSFSIKIANLDSYARVQLINKEIKEENYERLVSSITKLGVIETQETDSSTTATSKDARQKHVPFSTKNIPASQVEYIHIYSCYY